MSQNRFIASSCGQCIVVNLSGHDKQQSTFTASVGTGTADCHGGCCGCSDYSV
jgi:hypothetical protein